MVAILKNVLRRREALFLALFSVFCVILCAARIIRTGSIMYVFLVWNLFLAFIPYALSTFSVIDQKVRKSRAIILFISALWLLFFPNAPYILTDLVHLRRPSAVPMWFDLVLILSFSWAGLLYGMYSLRDMGTILNQWFSPFKVKVIQSGLLFLAAFGIYLGRYLRWNSWDLMNHPIELFFDIANRVLHPFQYAQTWGMTLLFGLFLNVVFLSIRKGEERGLM